MAQPGRKSKGRKWMFLYIFTATIDVLQIIMDLTGVGIAVSAIVEIAMPFIIIGILQFTGVSLLSRPQRLFSLLAAFGLGFLTGGAAPFWVFDIWYIHRDVKNEDAEYNAQQEKEMMLQAADAQALNEGGVRAAQIRVVGNSNTSTTSSGGQGRIINPPLNMGGTRRPTGRPLVDSRPQNIVPVDFGSSASAGEERKAA